MPGNWVITALSIVAGIGLWQLVVSVFHPNPLAVVGPWTVVKTAKQLWDAGTLWGDLSTSLEQFAIGFVVAVAAGVGAGLVLGASRRLASVFNPWVTILYTVPVIAISPLIIVGLGIGTTTKVVIVAISAFFPVTINAQAGVRSVDRGLRDVGAAFRASRLEMFRCILLPGAVPYILTGVRLGVSRGLIGLVFGDLFGATKGLGYLILSAQQNLETGSVYVAVVVLGVIGLLLGGIVSRIERHFAVYRTDAGPSGR